MQVSVPAAMDFDVHQTKHYWVMQNHADIFLHAITYTRKDLLAPCVGAHMMRFRYKIPKIAIWRGDSGVCGLTGAAVLVFGYNESDDYQARVDGRGRTNHRYHRSHHHQRFTSRKHAKIDHHAGVFVFEIVTMKQIGLVAGKIVCEVDCNPHRLAGPYQYRVLPAEIAHRSPFAETRQAR